MNDDQFVRGLFQQLTDDERAQVCAVFEDDIRKGWIPKPAEVAAVMGSVVARSEAREKWPPDRVA